MIDVPNVQRQPFRGWHFVPAMDLRPPRNPWANIVAPMLLSSVKRQVLFEQRAGADQAHLAKQDVPQLREFVQACPPKECTEGG
ncbi:MAG TPA: hypothetical protein VN442_00725 [Bryobacteraceae bacterium]|nr:hypothetical protein [Bryobacteraceae bacterium]